RSAHSPPSSLRPAPAPGPPPTRAGRPRGGPFSTPAGVRLARRPRHHPPPPFWYGSSNATGSTWAGERGLHFVTLGPTSFAKGNIEAYRAALAKRGAPAQPNPAFPGGAAVGVHRHIFVAETEAEAKRFGKPAMTHHLANLTWLR